jgi:hypothetical protein
VNVVRGIMVVVLAAGISACSHRTSSPTTPSEPQPPAPSPTLPVGGLNGTTIDAASDARLPGVTIRVEGLGQTTSGADGTFHLEADAPDQTRAVTITSDLSVDRTTHLRTPGSPATLSLISRSFDLPAFDEMARSFGALHRWTTSPPLVLLGRVLQFTNLTDAQYAGTGAAMTDGDMSGLSADLTWGLQQLSAGQFTQFAGETRETAEPDDIVNVLRPGTIVVARYRGLSVATGYWGYTRWSWNAAGELLSGTVMIDADFDGSGSPFRRSLRVHELGHALGYTHVTLRASVMNSSARFEPNTFDRDAAKIAFQRSPLNRSPDIDPDPYTVNRVAGGVTWAAMP